MLLKAMGMGFGAGLERAAVEGFDIAYLPPVFPIGVTNRKGRNNNVPACLHVKCKPCGATSGMWTL